MTKHALIVCALGLTLASSAAAQTNAAIGEKLFREAQEAMAAERYAEACAKFAKSNEADPQLGTLLNLATCHEKEGKPASAWSEYTKLVDLATTAGDKERADYARERAAALEPTLPQLELRVPRDVALTEVAIDGQALGRAALGTTIPVDPGDHELAFATRDKRWKQSVSVAPRGTTTLEVRVPEGAVTEAPPGIAGAKDVPDEQQASPLIIPGAVLAGAGGIGLVLGGVFGGLALSNKEEVDTHCVEARCTQPGLDASEDARTNSHVSTASFIAGGVLAAVGVTLLIVGATSNAEVGRVVPTPNGFMVAF